MKGCMRGLSQQFRRIPVRRRVLLCGRVMEMRFVWFRILGRDRDVYVALTGSRLLKWCKDIV